jgi:flagellar hook assembly protein FlgD
MPVDSGSIEIYNVSGVLIRTLDIPRYKLDAATYANPHSIYWDGRDMAGDLVANGTYIYVIRIEWAGSSLDVSGKSVRLR